MRYRVQLGKKYYQRPKKEVKVTRAASQAPVVDYNPYDLVPLLVGEGETTARPVAFDSELVDTSTLRNAAGQVIRPIKFNASCPHCGHLLDVDQPDYTPGMTLVAGCAQCGVGTEPALPELPDPFWNPVEAGLVKEHDLDTTLGNLDTLAIALQPAPAAPTSTLVADSVLDLGMEPEDD